jgi:hypothetical protein
MSLPPGLPTQPRHHRLLQQVASSPLAGLQGSKWCKGDGGGTDPSGEGEEDRKGGGQGPGHDESHLPAI